MKKVAFFTLLISAILFPIGVEAGNIVNGIDMDQAGGSGSSQWTGTTTITPTTATSTAAGYTSNVTTGVFQFGTQAAIGATYSPVTGGGRLGVGTTAPAGPIDLSQTVGDTTVPLTVRQANLAKGIDIYGPDGTTTLKFDIDANSRPHITGSSAFFHLGGSGFQYNILGASILRDSGNIGLTLNGSGTELGLTVTNTVTAQANTSGFSVTGGLLVSGLAGVGDIGADANGQFQAASDEKLKNLAEPIKATLEDIMGLQGYQYTWTPESGVSRGFTNEFPEVGFTAQNVRSVFPKLVNDKTVAIKRRIISEKINPDTGVTEYEYETYKEIVEAPHLNYSTKGLVAYLVEALKDANNRIKALEASNADILKRLEALEAK